MNETLIELRRSRGRKSAAKRRSREALECAGVFVLSFCMVLAILMFFAAIWLTDPAYGATPEYLYSTPQLQMIRTIEFRELEQIVYLESNTEEPDGQMAVIEVVFNRVEDPAFPETIHGVISQPGQFSTWKIRNKAKSTQEQTDYIISVMDEETSVMQPYIDEGKEKGEVNDDVCSKDYIYFCTPESYKKTGHKYMNNAIRIGGHVFGTKKETKE